MSHLLPLVAGLLMLADAHASDVTDSSMHRGFLSKYMGSDASKTSLGDYSTFVTPRLNHLKHGGSPDALSYHNGAAEHGPATVFDKSPHPTAPAQDSMAIGMFAIGVSLLTLAAMLGVRMRRGLQHASAFASSDRHESDMSIALASSAAGNIMERKTQDSTIRGEVGWSQQSSKNSHPLTLCYATSMLSDDVFPSTATDVFVGNMPYGMSDDYVKDLCYTVRKEDGSPVNPEILRVTVPRDEETGKDRGLAFIKVLDATQAADLAAGLNGFEYSGRVLNSNVKESKKGWVERPEVDPATLDDGGLFEALDTLEDKFAIQEYGLEKIRNACKKARIKAGGDLEQCSARLLKIKGLKPEVYLDPAFGLIPTRNNRRNTYYR